jgi:hypothetical protein
MGDGEKSHHRLMCRLSTAAAARMADKRLEERLYKDVQLSAVIEGRVAVVVPYHLLHT